MLGASSLRQIRFIDQTTFRFDTRGTITQNSLLLHDVDGDGHTEFVVGDLSGALQVFKFQHARPVYRSANLGSISCMTTGTIADVSIMCVVCAEGECHFFSPFRRVASDDGGENTAVATTADVDDDDDGDQTQTKMSGDGRGGDRSSLQSVSTQITDYNSLDDSASLALSNRSEDIDLTEDVSDGEEVDDGQELEGSSDARELPDWKYATKAGASNDNSRTLFQSGSQRTISTTTTTSGLRNTDIPSGGHVRPPQPKPQFVIPFCTQRIPCNITSAIFIDLDNDGRQKIIFGGSDRNVYVYDIIVNSNEKDDNGSNSSDLHIKLVQIHRWPLFRQVHSLSVHLDNNSRESLLVGLVSGGYALIASSRPSNADSIGNTPNIKESQLDGSKLMYTVTLKRDSSSYSLDTDNDNDSKGNDDESKGESIDKTTLDESHSIGSSSPTFTTASIPIPGTSSGASGSRIGLSSSSPSLISPVESNNSNMLHNNNANSAGSAIGMPLNVVPNVRLFNQHPALAAFVGMDGKLVVQRPLEHQKHLQREPLVQLDLIQEVLAVDKADMTRDGYEELVVATWDGVTYIIDGDRNIAFYNLKERISGFRMGMYSLCPTKKDQLCFFYVTFYDQIVMFSDVVMESVPAFTLLNSLQYKLEKGPLAEEAAIKDLGQSVTTVRVRYQLMLQKRYSSGRHSDEEVDTEIQSQEEQKDDKTAEQSTDIPIMIHHIRDMVKDGLVTSLLCEWDDDLMESYLHHLRRNCSATSDLQSSKKS